MKINFVVAPQHKTRFSGGILCVFEYARGLAELGHAVHVVPYAPSDVPEWFDFRKARFLGDTPQGLTAKIWSSRWNLLLGQLRRGRAGHAARKKLRADLRDLQMQSLALQSSAENRVGARIKYLQSMLPEADATIATYFESAFPVAMSGKGRLFYFMQHYEPYFKEEAANPELAFREAVLSYKLGLNMVANSTWLKQKVESEAGAVVGLCPNAIDHSVYNGNVKEAALGRSIKIISYGGRNARWKGFREMAEAVRKVRAEMPDREIIWQVYGDALLPPNNDIAAYHSLGFLQPPALAKAYAAADILLSASWYESYPLFPIEAMACGLPVITTAYGTEDYALHGQTAEVVQPQNPESVAAGLSRLIRDDSYRTQIARNGLQMSRTFTWMRSAKTMEALLAS